MVGIPVLSPCSSHMCAQKWPARVSRKAPPRVREVTGVSVSRPGQRLRHISVRRDRDLSADLCQTTQKTACVPFVQGTTRGIPEDRDVAIRILTASVL